MSRFDKSKLFPESQKDLAGALAQAGDNAADAAEADTFARVHRGTKREARRSRKTTGKALAAGGRLEQHLRSGRNHVSWAGPVDPLMLTVLFYFLSIGSAGLALEFGGSRATLQVWSDTLGGDVSTSLIAAFLGLVLTLLGHLIGHLVFTVTETRGAIARTAAAMFAVSLTVPAVLAIKDIGVDRPANLRAQSSLAKAALLETAAEDGEREARNADRRAAAKRGAVKPSAAGDKLRAAAAADRASARNITTKALDERRLNFFTAVQWAALALAIGGGTLWAAGEMERLRIRYEKVKAHSIQRRNELRTKFLAIASINVRSGTLAGKYMTPTQASDDQGFRAWFDSSFVWLFGKDPKWPDLENATPGATEDELEQRRRHRDDRTDIDEVA